MQRIQGEFPGDGESEMVSEPVAKIGPVVFNHVRDQFIFLRLSHLPGPFEKQGRGVAAKGKNMRPLAVFYGILPYNKKGACEIMPC